MTTPIPGSPRRGPSTPTDSGRPTGDVLVLRDDNRMPRRLHDLRLEAGELELVLQPGGTPLQVGLVIGLGGDRGDLEELGQLCKRLMLAAVDGFEDVLEHRSNLARVMALS